MANSSTLTSSVERRNEEPILMSVWERKVTFLVEADGGHTEISHDVEVNGLFREAFIAVGAAAGITGTVEVDFDDSDGVEFDTNSALGEGSETAVAMNSGAGIPINGFTIRVDPSDDPTTGNDDWEIVVTCRGT